MLFTEVVSGKFFDQLVISKDLPAGAVAFELQLNPLVAQGPTHIEDLPIVSDLPIGGHLSGVKLLTQKGIYPLCLKIRCAVKTPAAREQRKDLQTGLCRKPPNRIVFPLKGQGGIEPLL